MIKVNHLEKYYNKGQRNEIHVINDISLELPSKGLVVLLGPSGSGKTTLLNVLGGLDKVQKGVIDFDDETIEKYRSKTWDYLRNKHIGYIFQNYNLLEDMTVYDNIKLTLNMVGIVNKEEIDKRIDYILGQIGMANYRKRRASQLSGGQQQRVAIARALAKNPKVLIADEPTGNLDSKNTIDIMNIIKKISSEKLVVLVTHERDIAKFYADRIIELKDGVVVSDYQNSGSGDLDVQHESDIYLQDLEKSINILDDHAHIELYTDEHDPRPLHVQFIVKNKTLYIDVNDERFHKVSVLDKDSEVKIFDKHFEKVTKESFIGSSFDLDDMMSKDFAVEKHSVISVKESIKIAWNRMRNSSKLGKLFYLVFMGLAVLVSIAMGLLNNVLDFSPERYITNSINTIEVAYNGGDYDEFLAYEDLDGVGYLDLYRAKRDLRIVLPPLYQSQESAYIFSSKLIRDDVVNSSDLIEGRMSNDLHEIVIDKMLADELLETYSLRNLGIGTYRDLMALTLQFPIQTASGTQMQDIEVVGIADRDSRALYGDDLLLMMIYQGAEVYEYFADDLTITDGVAPTGDYQLLMRDIESSPAVGTQMNVNGVMYEIVGLYESDTVNIEYLVGKDTVAKILFDGSVYFDETSSRPPSDVFFEASNIRKAMSSFEDEGFVVRSVYLDSRAEFISTRVQDSYGTLIFIGVVLAASAVSFFFIIRSSLLSRIYEVSVYRALGVGKFDVHKMFAVEIILISTLTSLIGYLLTNYVLLRIQWLSEDYFDVISVSFLSLAAGLVIIYLVNIVSGLIPVANLLRKTPAEILSKYDF